MGVLTIIGPKGEVTVFGLGPKCDDLQYWGDIRLSEQKLIDVLLDVGGVGLTVDSWICVGENHASLLSSTFNA